MFHKKYFSLFIFHLEYYYLSVSILVSADMKNCISVLYRYWPIRKLYLLAHIGIGQYEKMLISHPLTWPNPMNLNFDPILTQKIWVAQKFMLSRPDLKENPWPDPALLVSSCRNIMQHHFFRMNNTKQILFMKL